MPRLMTLDLTGKLAGPTLRHPDQDQYGMLLRSGVHRRARPRRARRRSACTTLPVARARLGYRGYTREVSPDGGQPLIYDYDYVDPAPLASFAGKLTRHGDVARLLRADDDRLCLVGPGDEVQIEFQAADLPPLAAGLDAQLRRCVVSVTARTPTRSRPPATRSSRSPGDDAGVPVRCRRQAAERSALMMRTCGPTRPGRPGQGAN